MEVRKRLLTSCAPANLQGQFEVFAFMAMWLCLDEMSFCGTDSVMDKFVGSSPLILSWNRISLFHPRMHCKLTVLKQDPCVPLESVQVAELHA